MALSTAFRLFPAVPAGFSLASAAGAARLFPCSVFLRWSWPRWMPSGGARLRAKPRAIAHLKGLDGKPVGTAEFPRRGSRRIDRIRSGRPAAGAAWHPSACLGQLRSQDRLHQRRADPVAGPRAASMAILAEGGPEAGDLPNQFAGADGHLHARSSPTASPWATASARSSTATGWRSSWISAATITAPSRWAMPARASPAAW